jgi:signal transduction histidine kinase
VRHLSLRSRLLLWSGAASTVTLAAAVVLVDITFRAHIREQLEVGLSFARQIAEGARTSQIDERISEAAGLAVDPRLRAAVATADPLTIDQTLQEVHPPQRPGWTAIVDPGGSLLAATSTAPVERLENVDPLLSEALYYDTGDLWLLGGRLVEVGASAVLFGAEPLAVLLSGRALDRGRVSSLETVVGQPVAVVAGNDVVLGVGAPAISREARATLAESVPTDDGVELVELDGDRYLVTSTALLSKDGEPLGSAVLLASLDAALGPSNTLRAVLLAIFFLGLGLTFIVSGVLSRGITLPVGRLLAETERLGRGDLEHPIVPMRDDEIGRLAASFESMRGSLRTARSELIRAERLSAIGKAASAVAHDFTQPLSTIAGAIGLLRMDGDAREVRERCFGAIEAELDRLQRMKQEIVEFARGESQLDDDQVRIDSFLENTMTGLRAQLSDRRITLTIEHGFVGEWSIDSYRLGRVVDNLVRNAAAAISSRGSITVRSAVRAERLALEVVDDGPGIPPDRLEDVFEPFVSFGKKEGTGLGLAIARNVVEQHGGAISVSSGPDGTTFTIVLPRRADPSIVSPLRDPVLIPG